MSKFRGNGDACPHCGVVYADFRCGLSYADASARLWSHDSDPKTWKYKRRNTVLGVMHAEKMLFWKHHKTDGCPMIPQKGDEWVGEIRDERIAGVPF